MPHFWPPLPEVGTLIFKRILKRCGCKLHYSCVPSLRSTSHREVESCLTGEGAHFSQLPREVGFSITDTDPGKTNVALNRHPDH